MTTWTHNDTRGVDAIPQAIRRAKASMWGPANDYFPYSKGTRAADLRMIIAASYWAAGNLVGAVQIVDASGLLHIDANARTPDAERALTASVLRRTWRVLSNGETVDGDWETNAGDVARRIGSDLGAWPAVAGVVIVVIALGSWGIWCAERAHVEEHQATLNFEQANMVKGQAVFIEELNKQFDAEKAAGRPLPLSARVKMLRDGLVKLQDAAAKGAKPPVDDGLSVIERAVKVVAGSLSVGVILVALFVGASFLLKTRKE